VAEAAGCLSAQEGTLFKDLVRRFAPRLAKFLKSSGQNQVQELQVDLLTFIQKVSDGREDFSRVLLASAAFRKELCVRGKDQQRLRDAKLAALATLCQNGGGGEDNNAAVRDAYAYLLRLLRTATKPTRTEAARCACALAAEDSGERRKLLLAELSALRSEDRAAGAEIALTCARRLALNEEGGDAGSGLASEVNEAADWLLRKPRTRLMDQRETIEELLWALRVHCKRITALPAYLERLVEALPRPIEPSLHQPLLSAAVAAFATNPAAGQRVLGLTFRALLATPQRPETVERVRFYVALLRRASATRSLAAVL